MATESISLLALPAVRDFLALERVGHLATADATGVPHNVPLCFWFDGARVWVFRRSRNKSARPGDRPDAQYCGQPQRRAGR